ncbi:MAG: hypothetical protein OXB88_07990 [Bacteriovoracales bacterium]|nr:hypothetical protein [Bacteriovoracales bacterium]
MSKTTENALQRLERASASLEAVAALFIRAKEEIVFTENELQGIGILVQILAKEVEKGMELLLEQS